jgi:ABC-type amino acid transport substrate-binding protein
MSAAAAAEPGAEPAADTRPIVRVAATQVIAAVDWTGDRPRGLMIDTWANLADRIGVRTEFVRVSTPIDFFPTLTSGSADVAIGPLVITEEREKQIDFTHALFHSGLRIGVRQRTQSGLLAALRSLVSWHLLELLAGWSGSCSPRGICSGGSSATATSGPFPAPIRAASGRRSGGSPR